MCPADRQIADDKISPTPLHGLARMRGGSVGEQKKMILAHFDPAGQPEKNTKNISAPSDGWLSKCTPRSPTGCSMGGKREGSSGRGTKWYLSPRPRPHSIVEPTALCNVFVAAIRTSPLQAGDALCYWWDWTIPYRFGGWQSLNCLFLLIFVKRQ